MAKNTEIAVVKRNNSLPLARESAEHFIVPSADVYETADAFILVVDLPGVTKGTINVTMARETLTVKASVARYDREDAVVLVHELEHTGYYRTFNLGEGIDRESVDATFADGVLTITLFKSERSKAREIQIR